MGQPGLPRYFLGGEPTLNPGTNFTQGCLRKTFLPRSTHWHRNRFNRKSQKAAWLCFPLLSIPTHIKPGLHLKPDLWRAATSPSYHLQMGNARLTPFSLPRAESKLAPSKEKPYVKKWRALTYRQSKIITLQPDLQKLWEPGKILGEKGKLLSARKS